VIRIENCTLIELADSFLEITKGFDMPVGSVVVLSSLSYLARVGTAAYAEELVRAIARIRDAYASSVRIVHGFPVLIGGLDDESVIRSILEIELWLADSDKRECILCLALLRTSSLNGSELTNLTLTLTLTLQLTLTPTLLSCQTLCTRWKRGHMLALGGRTWQLVYPPCRKRTKKNSWEY
jgi:hypothetical protein